MSTSKATSRIRRSPRALAELKDNAAFFKVLGSYPLSL